MRNNNNNKWTEIKCVYIWKPSATATATIYTKFYLIIWLFEKSKEMNVQPPANDISNWKMNLYSIFFYWMGCGWNKTGILWNELCVLIKDCVMVRCCVAVYTVSMYAVQHTVQSRTRQQQNRAERNAVTWHGWSFVGKIHWSAWFYVYGLRLFLPHTLAQRNGWHFVFVPIHFFLRLLHRRNGHT